MKLPQDPRLPVLGGPDYDRSLYSRLYELFRVFTQAINDNSDSLAIAKWQSKLIGEPFPLWDHMAGADIPPSDNDGFRFIKLSYNDPYNTGVLTGQATSGTEPNIMATGVISLEGSPLNGQIVRLITTERRFVRPGVSGDFQEDAIAEHAHLTSYGWDTGVEYLGLNEANNSLFGSTVVSVNRATRTRPVNQAVNPARLAFTDTVINDYGKNNTETTPRNIGATYYMRIK